MDKNPFRKQAQRREKENNRDEEVEREEHGEKCIQDRGEGQTLLDEKVGREASTY